MINTEIVIINGRTLRKTMSDCGLYIQKVNGKENEKYAEAIDVLESTFEYVETSELIPIPTPTENEHENEI